MTFADCIPFKTTIGSLAMLAASAQAAPSITVTPIEIGSPSATQLYVEVTGNPIDNNIQKNIWVAAAVPGISTLFFNTPNGWTPYNGSSAQALLTSTSNTTNVDALNGVMDLSHLAGTQIYVGLAQNWPEMIASGDYALAYTVPGSTPSGAAGPAAVYVSTTGNDSNPGTLAQPWRTIQHAASTVSAGTTVYVRGGIYAEQVNVTHSGSASSGYITFTAYPGESPVVDGLNLQLPTSGTTGLFALTDVSYVQVNGFEIRNYTSLTSANTPAGIVVSGAGDHIAISNNFIHDIKNLVNNASGSAFGISVTGTRAPASIKNLTISGNEVSSLKTDSGESVALAGNVQYFSVTGNSIHDDTNTGIDLIGYSGTAPDSNYDRVRDGVVSGNNIYRISSFNNPAYGGTYGEGGIYNGAEGIFVNGGTRIIVERNSISASDIGMRLAGATTGQVSDYITVRDNVIYQNSFVGLTIGGNFVTEGGVANCVFANNTLYHNDLMNTYSGQFGVHFYTASSQFFNNIVYATSLGIVMSGTGEYTIPPLDFNGNLYYSDATSGLESWMWNKTVVHSLAAFQLAVGGDSHSQYADPQFSNAAAANFLPKQGSPAINAGITLSMVMQGSSDFLGKARVQGAAVDIGAYEQ